VNPTSEKLVSLFLVFAFLEMSCIFFQTEKGLSSQIYQEKKHGTNLFIEKKDGQFIKGELIAVKPNSLIILSTGGKDLSIGIKDIKIITVVKKSNAVKWAIGGLSILGSSAALLGGLGSIGDEDVSVTEWGAIGAGIGVLIGGIIGSAVGIDKTLQLEGMTDSEIQEFLDKLRKKARVRDYK
jgi:hypothetical protein